MRVRAAIIRATGAGYCRARRSSSCMRSRPSRGRPARSASPNGCRTEIPESVRRALADCEVKSGPGDPEIDPNWAEPGLTLAEKVFAWCTFEILAMESGVPASPVNAVPPRAWARGQIRFVVGTNPDEFLPALRRHLDRHGFPMVQIAHGARRHHDRVAARSGASVGALGRDLASPRPPTASPPCCRMSAARCRTTSSPTASACRPSGCRIPIRAARSMRRTSTSPSRSRARRSDDGRALLGPRRARDAHAGP